MPNYGTAQAGGVLTAIQPGDSLTLFNAETPAAPQASLAFARGHNPSGPSGFPLTFQIQFAAAPTDSLQILGTNVYQYPGKPFNLAEWNVLYTSTNLQKDVYTDVGASAYYCAYLASQSQGGAVTVAVQA